MILIPPAPDCFDGSLAELYESWATKVLLSSSAVEEFHLKLVAHLKSDDPLFLTRLVKGQERGRIVRNKVGFRLRATDNAPAWWLHAKLFDADSFTYDSFSSFIASIPSHMFEIRLPQSINSAGWHVAHIFNAKDRNLDYDHWDHPELTRRTIRNIHPCNYFYIPKIDWRVHGGEQAVIAFFCEKFAATYSAIWPEFLDLAGATTLSASSLSRNYRYTIPAEPQGTTGSVYDAIAPRERLVVENGAKSSKATYTSSRLAFKADIIEPLEWEDVFRVDTPVGSYAMTKREFYKVFPLIPLSNSYREGRLYSFPKPPKRVLQFQVDSQTA